MSFTDKKNKKQPKTFRSQKTVLTSYITISCVIQEIDHLGLGLPKMALVSCRCIDKTQGVVLNGSYSSYGWYQITTIWHPSPCDLCNSFTLNYSNA